MIIKREKCLNELIEKQGNKQIKVITGLRRCGKSFLLFNLFYDYLIKNNVNKKTIVTFAFDNMEDIIKLDKYYPEEDTLIYDANKKFYKVNAKKFVAYINDNTDNDSYYYLLLDEIQLLDNFVFVLNGFLKHVNFDVYVTGSNSRMLSKDILTEFRGRGDQIHIYPLSFKEYYVSRNVSFEEAYLEYQYFGGMPYTLELPSDDAKQTYLKGLFSEIYIKDIVDRNGIKNDESFETLLEVISSSIGSYTNPTNIENTFKSELKQSYHHDTIKKHIDYIKEAFLISEAKRYDIKGREYIGANSKYYFTDIGLRNALINFRQSEPNHIMENIIYNELILRGYSVDVGIVEINEENKNGNYVSKQLETDFVCNKMSNRIYIQSAYYMESIEKQNQEKKSLLNIKDNFRKIIVVRDSVKKYYTQEGIEVVSLMDFLLGNIDI